jgi:hypothetical protein
MDCIFNLRTNNEYSSYHVFYLMFCLCGISHNFLGCSCLFLRGQSVNHINFNIYHVVWILDESNHRNRYFPCISVALHKTSKGNPNLTNIKNIIFINNNT